jgi:hypothetical protein
MYNLQSFFILAMLQNMLFKPSDYDSWIGPAILKIQKSIDSCKTEGQLETSRNMVDNFVMMLLLNDEYPEQDITYISRQLFLYLQIKKLSLYASY